MKKPVVYLIASLVLLATILLAGVSVHGTAVENIVSNLVNVSGTVIPTPAPPSGGSGGGGGGSTYTDTSILGSSDEIYQNYKGETIKEFTATDGELTINIPKGTAMKDSKGNPLTKLNIQPDSTQHPALDGVNVIGLAYDFSPNGAQFGPPINLTFSYSELDIPEGVSEGELVIAYWDSVVGKWVELECVVDVESNTITAKVSHFTTFAIIGVVVPAETPAPTLTPSPTSMATPTPTLEPTETVKLTEKPSSTTVEPTGTTTPSATTVTPSDSGFSASSIAWIVLTCLLALVVVILIIQARLSKKKQ